MARFRVGISNPRPTAQLAVVRPVLPVGWGAVPDVVSVSLPPLGHEEIEFEVAVCGPTRRRARLAVDVDIGGLRLGQHAEALVDVTHPGST